MDLGWISEHFHYGNLFEFKIGWTRLEIFWSSQFFSTYPTYVKFLHSTNSYDGPILLLTDFDIQSLQVVDQLHENLPWRFATATFCLIPISCQGYFTDFTDLRSSNRRGSPMRTLSRALATQSGRNSQTKALEVQISLPKTYDPVTPWKSQVSWPSRTEAATGSSIPSAKKWRT